MDTFLARHASVVKGTPHGLDRVRHSPNGDILPPLPHSQVHSETALMKRGISFERRDNCFAEVGDVEAAQHELDPQLKTPWARTLDRLLDTIHPSQKTMFGGETLDYILVSG